MSETTRLGARLRAARKTAGFKTSKSFLKKHAVPASTYSQHESGARMPDDETLKFYSKVFDVNYDWLKYGKGRPFGQLSTAQKTIFNDELLDSSMLKKRALNTSPMINAKCLTKILDEVLTYHTTKKLNTSLSKIVANTIRLYIEVTQTTNDYKSEKKAMMAALKKYKSSAL